MTREIAVFGGSFDPPHIGHVFLATYALSVGGVERVLVAPTYQHAFGKPLTDFAERMHMCELAFAPLSGVEVIAIERELGGTSLTLRLVTELAARYPTHRLRLLVGADILLESARWQRFDEICQLAPPLVAHRAGYARAGNTAAPLLPEVSSTAIRRALASGDDVSGWLPASVCAYAEQRRIYGVTAP